MTIELTASHSGLVHISAQGAEIAVNTVARMRMGVGLEPATPEFTAMFLMQQVLVPGSQVRAIRVEVSQ